MLGLTASLSGHQIQNLAERSFLKKESRQEYEIKQMIFVDMKKQGP